MKNLFRQKYFYLTAGIFLLAVFLIFSGLKTNDLYSDHAHYAFRALGWFDFLTGQGQTSPLNWFGQTPWWGRLSFHDHPPLSFLLQRVCFVIFGDTNWAARLPFALAGLGTVILVYLLLFRFENKKIAGWGALMMTVSAYSVWSVHAGYLEAIETFFLVLSWYLFLAFLKSEKKIYFIFWSVATALAILTKYTAIFLLPAVLTYLLIKNRRIFLTREFYLAGLIGIIILSPLIIYNAMIFKYRGHFDSALSAMVGLNPADYAMISQRQTAFEPLSNGWQILVSIQAVSSWPFLALLLFGLVYLIVKFLARKTKEWQLFLIFNLLWLILLFIFGAVGLRFVSIIMPALVLTAAILISDLFLWLENKKSLEKIAMVFLGLIIGVEFLYCLNTNVLTNPVGVAGLAYSSQRFYNRGFLELDNYLREKVLPKPLKFKVRKNIHEITKKSLVGQEAILLDERCDWFSKMWHVDRYLHYYGAQIIIFSSLNDSLTNSEMSLVDYLAAAGAKGIWIIVAVGEGVVYDSNQDYNDFIESTRQDLAKFKIKPVKVINDYKGEPVFEIYHFYAK